MAFARLALAIRRLAQALFIAMELFLVTMLTFTVIYTFADWATDGWFERRRRWLGNLIYAYLG